MKKKTQPQLAKEYGLTLDVIKKLKQDGVDIQDEKAVRLAKSKQRHRIKPSTSIPDSELDTEEEQTLADFKKLLLTTTDIDTTKIVKEKAIAYKNLIAAEKEEGLVIPINIVEERETKIGAAVKSAFDKVGNELPGACAGLDEVGIMNVYEDLKREALTMLADLTSEFWKERK